MNKQKQKHTLNAPRRLISALLIEGEDSQLEKKCISILNKYARIVYHNNKLYAYGLNANYFKDLLKRQLSASEYDRLKLRLRSSFYRRDLLDLTDDFVAETLLFYYSFAVLTLKPHDKTINIYLPEHDEKRAQIYEWILTAMQKFMKLSLFHSLVIYQTYLDYGHMTYQQ